MFLHLGQDKVVKTADIIGIFDLDSTTVYKTTRDFLAKAEKEGRVINVASDLPKTFLIVNEEENTRVYISGISASTLQKKAIELAERGSL